MPIDPAFENVVTAILDAFPAGPPPSIEPPSPEHEEVVDAAAKLEAPNLTWSTAPDDVLDAIYDAGPWLTPESFVYWLPAFLIDIGTDWRRADFRGDTIISELTRPEPEDLPRRLERLEKDRARLGERTYEFLVLNTTQVQTELAGPQFRSKWNEMTPRQRAAVGLALDYLARTYGRSNYKQALARWPADVDRSLP